MLTLAQQVEDLFAEYWDIAYNEGHLKRPDGDKANAVLHKLRALLQPSADAQDAARYRWLRERMMGADMDWNESGAVCLVFEMPSDARFSADCDTNIDGAMAKGEQQ